MGCVSSVELMERTSGALNMKPVIFFFVPTRKHTVNAPKPVQLH